MVSFKDILSYYQDYKAIALSSITASSVFEIIDLVVPYSIGQILNVLSGQPVDKFIQPFINQATVIFPNLNDQWASLGFLLGLIVVTSVVKAPIQPWIGAWFHWNISLQARRDRLKQVIGKILTLPIGFYDTNNPGRIASKITKGVENYLWTYPEIAGRMIPKVAKVLGIFVVILLIEPPIAIAFLVSFVFILIYSLKRVRDIIQQEEQLSKYQENTESHTSEIITNIKTVKAFATEAEELERQRQRLFREYKVVTYRVHRSYVILDTWLRTMVQTCVFLILLFTLIPTVQGNMSLGHFITTLTVSSMAYGEIEPIGHFIEIFARRYPSMAKLQEFIKLPLGQDAASLEKEDVSANPYKFTGKLEIQNLVFGYDPQRAILQDINLLIEPYQTIALVGRSGSGKSTLVKLLFRYFEPDAGKIILDGEDIKSLDIARYRRRLAIVHQDVDIFNGTVLNNLTYGDRQVSLQKVQEACQVAQVDEFISELPEGYYTIVGERGVRLSGGQRQRLGIARALIVNPDILVFDEATSSLDYESERSIQLAMRSIFGTRTTIIIAHRLSTVREADKIVVLDAGKIVEVGTHQELLSRGGIYHRLHSLQETGELI
ncbi:ABC-type multidrug transport system, ATPase and permease component [Xenococcus sp. PCC 7305]|uniref:ABC transporter ATP-binding protein n=1 Tax=Xenococcus sp. PCC 7305 TaxID=102125 RepID=UPI0002AD0EC1|nr:ABC transporter ATP-binding protein [Xenococcus sp. PCC 7305]ELS00619.1 ABC-type multidrug transport system, ATPase and permease component [Xenococcus sp. PCC 7305]